MNLSESALRVALVCFYDAKGVATIAQTVRYMQTLSRHRVEVVNLFYARASLAGMALPPAFDLASYDALVVHNSVSYNVQSFRAIDRFLMTKLKDYPGVKVLMKQDENYHFREMAEYIGEVGFDLLLSCLPPEDVPKIYPPGVVGEMDVVRMLTGYVTPELRARGAQALAQKNRPIDIGYRGSIQPLSFGRLAYEKRAIGEEVKKRLAGRGLTLDISSRWEDRIGGEAWFSFLSQSKATLGAESGASVFGLDGSIPERIRKAEAALGAFRADASYAEAYLAFFADIEGDVAYQQLSPRHFEAAATGTLQLLFPGDYSGVLVPHVHYFPLARDFSNLEEAVALLQDDARRAAITHAAYRDIIVSPRWGIEQFVTDLDMRLSAHADRKQWRAVARPAPALPTRLRARYWLVQGAVRVLSRLTHAQQMRLHRCWQRLRMRG